jgi:hypothetical protein
LDFDELLVQRFVSIASQLLTSKTRIPNDQGKRFFVLESIRFVFLLQEGNYLVKDSSLLYDDYVEISVCDVDEDGLAEVLASVGNLIDENVTAIYEQSDQNSAPFVLTGYICCDTEVEYKGGGLFWAYRGNLKDKLHDTYFYNGVTLLLKLA